MSQLVPITAEQREESKQKRLKDQQFARENLYISSKDEQFHRDLAAKLGVRMPSWWIPGSEVKYIRRACKKLNVEVSEFIESTGFKNIKELSESNPKWTAFGLVSLVLEWYSQNNAQKA